MTKLKIKRRLNQTPLWKQLVFFLSFILLAFTLLLSVSSYLQSRKTAIQSQIDKSERLLDLKMINMEKYIDELSDFCIQPCYDNEMYANILSAAPLSSYALSEMENDVHTFYYTRTDLISYQIYLMNQGISIGREKNEDRIWVRNTPVQNVKSSHAYSLCSSSPYLSALLPSDDPDTFFNFNHAIIRIRDHAIMAIVTINIRRSTLAPYISKSAGSDEFFCIYNSDGELLYSGNTDLVSTADSSMNNALSARNDQSSGYIRFDNRMYLVTSASGDKYGLKIVSLVPVSEITDQFKKAQSITVLQGLLLLGLAICAIYLLIRKITSPLSLLSSKQKDVGEGDFSQIHIEGCREIADLSNSFNEMTAHIDELIRENYMAQLDEKNARLAALEAQINPHFLYNTLQAIGSEALLNDQKNIYHMLTGLASSLRYSIKASNIVTLEEELRYVNDYIMLQKIRMEDHLEVTQEIDEKALQARVPKISLQTLVENSILHGLQDGHTTIHIQLKVFYRDHLLYLQVTDDGCGIEPDELTRLRQSLHEQTLQDSGKSIGLVNLYNRIHLMYSDQADLQIDSCTGTDSHTTVTLTVEEKDHESSDHR
jgi:two-component system sensor histidine kinase YesM